MDIFEATECPQHDNGQCKQLKKECMRVTEEVSFCCINDDGEFVAAGIYS